MHAEALNRTTLLMRTELADGVAEDSLIEALTGVTAVIVAGPAVIATSAGRTAVITAALLMARSGHSVWLACPDVRLDEPQPPLAGTMLHDALSRAGDDLIPGCAIRPGLPPARADLAIVLGEASAPEADQVIWLGGSDWSATLSSTAPGAWTAVDWPIGALAAAALAAGEAFKASMRRLADVARSRVAFDMTWVPSTTAEVTLAPETAARARDLGTFDMVSGGAIANAALFVLLRLPEVSGVCRTWDDDEAALSNLNRNALLLRSAVGTSKVTDLARYGRGLKIEPVPVRFQAGHALGSTVLLGVDDIPSRWAAQGAGPDWMGVGATAGFAVQVSAHDATTACVGCLHPQGGEATGPIPTASFVSFWSGLLLAVRLLRHRADEETVDAQTFFSPMRPEAWPWAGQGMSPRADCPVGCDVSRDLMRSASAP